MSDLEYKVEEIKAGPDTDDGAATRTIYNRHGVRFIVQQGGVIGEADAQATLMTLVTGLALLAIATTLVDALMQYALQDRDAYKTFKTQETPDFGEIRELPDPEREAYVEKLKATSDASAMLVNRRSAASVADPLLGDSSEKRRENQYS